MAAAAGFQAEAMIHQRLLMQGRNLPDLQERKIKVHLGRPIGHRITLQAAVVDMVADLINLCPRPNEQFPRRVLLKVA